MYGIGQFARLTGVTPKALYVYERHGLLKPRRSQAGYRRYSARDLQQLERVLSLKSLGLSLDEIARVHADRPKLRETLSRRRTQLERKRDQIDRAVRQIDAITQDAVPDAAVDRFFRDENWDRWEAKRHEAGAGIKRPPDRASASRVALFHAIAEALDRDASGASATPLIARWNALLEEEAGGDDEVAAARRQAWTHRGLWPDGLRRYVASLYNVDPAEWDRVAGFLESHLG